MPFCPNCGKSVGEEDRFCPACGQTMQPTVQEPLSLAKRKEWTKEEWKGFSILVLMGSTFIALSYFCYQINTTWYWSDEGITYRGTSRTVAAIFCPLGVFFDALALLSTLYALKIGYKKVLMIIVSIFLCFFLYIGIDLIIKGVWAF